MLGTSLGLCEEAAGQPVGKFLRTKQQGWGFGLVMVYGALCFFEKPY